MNPGINLRPMRRSDNGRLIEIWNATAIRPITPALFDEKVWVDPDVSDALRFVATSGAGDVIGFGVAAPRSPVMGGGAIKLLSVVPQYQRMGVGTALVTRLESALRRGGHTTIRLGESPPNYLQPGIDAASESTFAFFEKMGFIRIGTVHDMLCSVDATSCETAADEHRLAGAGIMVRRANAGDALLLESLLAAFWPAWKPEVAAALSVTPTAVHVAVAGTGSERSIAGFAAHSANNRAIGWFGPMGTDPAFRGAGIGATLLKRCLKDLADAGFDQVTIPWVGPVGFYQRSVGAKIYRTYYRYEKQLHES